jgi:hypothetical protein
MVRGQESGSTLEQAVFSTTIVGPGLKVFWPWYRTVMLDQALSVQRRTGRLRLQWILR